MSIVWFSVVFVLLVQAGGINASVKWPEGFYGLLKPETGCPEKQWVQDCAINQDTVNYKPDNEKSEGLHLDGKVNTSNVERHFCLKTKWYGPKWPKGQYCVYSKFKKQEMHWGSIRMYNEWYDNQDSVSTSCRDFFHGQGTKHIDLHFACQTSGNKTIPISLPITKPFYLLPYGSRDCQQVEWMVATSEWIWYHTRNYNGRHYKEKTVPYHELGANSTDRGIKMYYCYYKSCNYTLNDTTGVFQSPGFPGKYPDGQLCSWRIMVPENHTLHVHFTHFSLYQYDEDCLQLYENTNGIFEPKQAFFGNQRPFTITATRDLMFVFRSDEENKSTGFRAEYTMSETPERMTATPKPLTTTPRTAPTIFMTTKPSAATETKFPTKSKNENLTANKTLQSNPAISKSKSYSKQSIQPMGKKTCFCDETWKIVVMVIPLALFILIFLVMIDIFCRCRSKRRIMNGANISSDDDGMVANPTYERCNIILDQPADSTDESPITLDDQPHQRNETHDYENVVDTQPNDIPPPTRSSSNQDYHPLLLNCADTSAVSNQVLEPPNMDESVLEPPNTGSNGQQCYVAEPIDSGASGVLGRALGTGSTGVTRTSYRNLCVYRNPVYEPADDSAPLGEANKPWDFP